MKKTMIFMLLCAAMATAFTACEKDPAADDPAGQEGNNGNVNENPGGSDGYLVPWETSERLLKTVECSSGEKAEIEYDSMGRPVRIDITTSYGSTQESNLTYEVNAMTITSVEDYVDGEPYEAMLTYTWNNEGYMIDCPIGEPYVSRFEYKDNYLVRCYEDTSIQDADNIWQDGNLMAGYTLLMDGNFTSILNCVYPVLDKKEDITCHNYFAKQHTIWVEDVLLERSEIIREAVKTKDLYIAKCHFDHATGLVNLI